VHCFFFFVSSIKLTKVALSDGTWKEIERVEKVDDEQEEDKKENVEETLDSLNGNVTNELNGTTESKDITTESDTSKVCFFHKL
jgi:hypothetical protein